MTTADFGPSVKSFYFKFFFFFLILCISLQSAQSDKWNKYYLKCMKKQDYHWFPRTVQVSSWIACLLPQHADALMLSFSLLHDDENTAVLEVFYWYYINNFMLSIFVFSCDTNVIASVIPTLVVVSFKYRTGRANISILFWIFRIATGMMNYLYAITDSPLPTGCIFCVYCFFVWAFVFSRWMSTLSFSLYCSSAGSGNKVVPWCPTADDRCSGEGYNAKTRVQFRRVCQTQCCPLLSEECHWIRYVCLLNGSFCDQMHQTVFSWGFLLLVFFVCCSCSGGELREDSGPWLSEPTRRDSGSLLAADLLTNLGTSLRPHSPSPLARPSAIHSTPSTPCATFPHPCSGSVSAAPTPEALAAYIPGESPHTDPFPMSLARTARLHGHTSTPPITPPSKRRHRLKPPCTPPPPSRKVLHLLPNIALTRSKSHESQLGNRIEDPPTNK